MNTPDAVRAPSQQQLGQAIYRSHIHAANNFHFLRLVFALTVAVYHAVMLPGLVEWEQLEYFSGIAAELAVQGFFVISGFLVWESHERSKSLALYAEKRARRLLPAYVVTVVICALVAIVASALSRDALEQVGRYLAWNLAFLNFMEPSLPSLFAANPLNEVNGALWTIKIEVLFYLVLPALAWCIRQAGRLRWLVFVVIYAASELWRFSFESWGRDEPSVFLVELSRQLPGQMSFFCVGVALAIWRDQINWFSALPLVAIILTVASISLPSVEFVRACGIGLLVIWLAIGIPRMIDGAIFGDFSYGLYVAHFPIIQGVVSTGLFVSSPVTGLMIGIGLSLVAAIGLWWLIERPALRRDSAYRRAPERT